MENIQRTTTPPLFFVNALIILIKISQDNRTLPRGLGHRSPMLQCSPSQPGWHTQVPSWHWPCSSQRGWHALWSHAAPIQPSPHWHWPSEQTPWLPHGTGHSSAEQVGGDMREKKKHLSVRGEGNEREWNRWRNWAVEEGKNVKEAPGTQRAERSFKELGVSHWIQVRKKITSDRKR